MARMLRRGADPPHHVAHGGTGFGVATLVALLDQVTPAEQGD